MIEGLSLVAALAFAKVGAAQPSTQPGSQENVTTSTEVVTVPVTPAPMPVHVEPARDEGHDDSKLDHWMPGVKRAFELQLSGGVGWGAGDGALTYNNSEPRIQDIADPGGTVGLTLGYRSTKHFMIGLYGTGSWFSRGSQAGAGADIRSLTAGVQADYHFRPNFGLDPWISLATGWRGLQISPDNIGKTTAHGFELARVNLGLDLRMTRGVAISPVIGGDMSLFVTQDGPGQGFSNIDNPKLNFFLFGGLQARFDVGKQADTSTATQNRSTTTF